VEETYDLRRRQQFLTDEEVEVEETYDDADSYVPMKRRWWKRPTTTPTVSYRRRGGGGSGLRRRRHLLTDEEEVEEEIYDDADSYLLTKRRWWKRPTMTPTVMLMGTKTKTTKKPNDNEVMH